MPGSISREISIPGNHGTYDQYNSILENRILEVEIAYKGTSLNNLRTKSRSIASWLNTLTGCKTLTFDDETTRPYNARLFDEIALQNLFLLGQTTLQFECEPFSYSDYDEYNNTYYYDKSLGYDTAIYYQNTEGFTCSSTFQMFGLYNYSIIPTPVKITVTGTTDKMTIYHEQSNITLSITAITTAANVIVIENSIITIDDVFINNTGYFFEITAGNNGFQFNGMMSNTTVEFEWEHKWL